LDVFGDAGALSRMLELNRPEKLNCLTLEMLEESDCLRKHGLE
jgi:enoyl-CoA hydratase/carnithine racemase